MDLRLNFIHDERKHLVREIRINRNLKINNHNFTNFGQFEVIFAEYLGIRSYLMSSNA